VGGTVGGAVLGIGVNVETQPEVEATPFVPRTGTLRVATSKPSSCTQGSFFTVLAAALDANYSLLLGGEYEALLQRYRERSIVTGRQVTLCADQPTSELDVIAQGRATGIGDDLGLMIEGYERPFTKGRLIIGTVDELVSRKR
jgi:biotin-(acetyl-CoA carboxylase) ligase